MVRITERDVRLVSKCAAAQWLTTGQIQRMFFGDSTPDAVRKRLRKLADAGYLQSSQPHRMAEMLHAVGRQGQSLLAQKGLDIRVGRKTPDHIEHCIGINDIRIAVESARWRAHYFFAHWELGQFGWNYAVIPDAVFSVQTDWRMTFMAEYDRGTEGREVLLRKLRQYEGFSSGFRFDGVVVVADSEKIGERLCGSLLGSWRFALGVCCMPDLRDAGVGAHIFSEPGRMGKVSLAELAKAPDEE
jgi:hypothetical protein